MQELNAEGRPNSKPSAAVAFSSLGLLLQVLAFIVEAFVFSLILPGKRIIIYGPFMLFWSFSFLIIGLVFLTVGISGIILINSGNRRRVASGGTLVIISSVLAFPTLFGFFLGSIFMFIGGILALFWAQQGRANPQIGT